MPHARNFIVCNQDNEPLGALFGCLTIWRFGPEYFIDELFIAHNHQRQGLGKLLMDDTSKILAGEGVSSIVLNTDRGFPSEKFYQSCGLWVKEEVILMVK